MDDGDSPDPIVRADIYRHPLLYLLLGGTASIVLIRWGFTLSATVIWIGGLLGLLCLGLLAVNSNRGWAKVGLTFIGFGAFGLYALGFLFPNRVTRQTLLNEQVHLRGIYDGNGRLTSSTINNDPLERTFYLPNFVLERSGSPADTSPRLNVSMTATVKWPHTSPGFADYLRTEGYIGYLDVDRIHNRLRAPPRTDAGVRDYLVKSFAEVERRWPKSISFLRALILGNKQALDRHDRTVLKRLGLVHLFVISGLHVMILFSVFRGLLKPFGDHCLLGGTVGLLLSYLWFLGWPVSATRASIMIVVLVGLEVTGRRTTRWSSLFIAVLIMMLFDPFVVLGPGFQLTVAAVVGIFVTLDYASYLQAVPGLDFAVVSTGAFLGVMPVLLYHFHYIPALGSVFAAFATAIFPVFFGLVIFQWGLIELRWTAVADLLEGLFSSVMSGHSWAARHVGYLSVTDVSFFTVLILAVVLFWTLVLNRHLLTRFISLAVVLVVLTGVIGSQTQPHLDVRLVKEQPVVIHQSTSGTNLLVPRFVRLKPHHLEELGRILRDKGVRHVERLISDYPRTVFEQLEPTFTVGQYHVHWRRDDELSLGKGSYNFSSSTLSVPQGTVEFGVPSGVELSGYQPSVLVARQPGRRCFLNDIERVEDRVYKQIQALSCEKVLLRESSAVMIHPGRRVDSTSIATSVEQWFLNHVLRVKRLITSRGN